MGPRFRHGGVARYAGRSDFPGRRTDPPTPPHRPRRIPRRLRRGDGSPPVGNPEPGTPPLRITSGVSNETAARLGSRSVRRRTTRPPDSRRLRPNAPSLRGPVGSHGGRNWRRRTPGQYRPPLHPSSGGEAGGPARLPPIRRLDPELIPGYFRCPGARSVFEAATRFRQCGHTGVARPMWFNSRQFGHRFTAMKLKTFIPKQ